MAETNTLLQSNDPPLKNKYIKFKPPNYYGLNCISTKFAINELNNQNELNELNMTLLGNKVVADEINEIEVILKQPAPMVLAPSCPRPAFCLWKTPSQRISLMREVRNLQKQRETAPQD